jgi:hypothetical protein
MDDSTITRRSEAPVGASDRLRLARAARAAMLAVPGVITADSGPAGLHVTTASGERLEGIICAATSDGGYDISVRLIADLVALPDLSDRVTAAINRAAARVEVPCSSVAVHVADVEPGGVR